MLKKIIEEDAYNELEDAVKPLYQKHADDKYHLQVEDDNADALRAARDKEKEERKKLQERLDQIDKEKQEAERKAQEAKDAEARAKGDVEALEQSWKKKVEDARAEGQTQAERATIALHSHMIDATAQQIANDISTVPTLLVDKIKARLKLELPESGDAIVRVLDSSGKPSAMSVAELRQEFIDNKEFKSIIKASNGSGGGASGSNGGGGAGSGKKLSEMNATEEAAFANENPDEYQKWIEAGRPK